MVNRFGSTSDMVIQSVEENGAQYLLAIDEKGFTSPRRNIWTAVWRIPTVIPRPASACPLGWRPCNWTRRP